MKRLLCLLTVLLSACSLTVELDGLTAGGEQDASIGEGEGPSSITPRPGRTPSMADSPSTTEDMEPEGPPPNGPEPDEDEPEPEPEDAGSGNPEPDSLEPEPLEPEPLEPEPQTPFGGEAGNGGDAPLPDPPPDDDDPPVAPTQTNDAGVEPTPRVEDNDSGVSTPVGGGGSGPVGSGGTPGGAGGSTPEPEGPAPEPDVPDSLGCAVLTVPLAAEGDRTLYMLELPQLVDFSAASLTYRVYVDAGVGGRIIAFAQHGAPDYQLIQGGQRFFDQLDGWTDVTWNVGDVETTFDKSVIKRIGFEISTEGAAAWSNPTVVYLDWITLSSNMAGPFTFDDASSVSSAWSEENVLYLAQESWEFVPGSTIGWASGP
jgi:hypothetical protein